MTIDEHAEIFNGSKVSDYDPSVGIGDTELAYRLSLDWDDMDAGKSFSDLLQKFLEDANAGKIRSLVIGCWGEPYENPPTAIIQSLTQNSKLLTSLEAIFFGDIIGEESEISWIEQTDYREFFAAYPRIKCFRVRGGQGLRLSRMQLSSLEKLVVETGGLPASVLEDIKAAELPALTHLELWLGSDQYGFDASVDDIVSLLEKPMPHLRYLGLRNCEIADELAQRVAQNGILKQLHVLDMSLGNMSDTGANALLESPLVRGLQALDLHFHYISDELQQKLRKLDGVSVDVSDQQEDDVDGDEIYRYIAVAE
ncbi:MAG: STM4015 family protein [Gammaproteobacteria bacterium]|nr:STM4015 family protein [Gammaproteobacteria bacterium]MDH5803104.1 STM4015 family protein [Gammaproteobacteria bacterium]